MKWMPELSLDHPTLDDQHRSIMEAAGRIYETYWASDRSSLSKHLAALVKALSANFVFEERLMAQSQYGEAAIHAEQHREILDQLRRFSGQLAAGRFMGQSPKVLRYLEQWIWGHILNFDHAFVAHLRAENEGRKARRPARACLTMGG